MFTINDLIDFIVESDLENDKKSWLLKNVTHLRSKYQEKFNEDIEL